MAVDRPGTDQELRAVTQYGNQTIILDKSPGNVNRFLALPQLFRRAAAGY